jgi:hypothetical protein
MINDVDGERCGLNRMLTIFLARRGQATHVVLPFGPGAVAT